MIKFFQWYDLEKLQTTYKNHQDVLDLIDSYKDHYRKNRFYEYYHMHNDMLVKERNEASDALDIASLDNPLVTHLDQMIQNFDQVVTERDMYKDFYFGNKIKK